MFSKYNNSIIKLTLRGQHIRCLLALPISSLTYPHTQPHDSKANHTKTVISLQLNKTENLYLYLIK